MAEYIDREEVIDKLTMLFPLLKKRTIKNILKAVPTADVQHVVHGRWVEAKYPLFTCSECGAMYQENGYGYNYCPNCGADMRGNNDG